MSYIEEDLLNFLVLFGTSCINKHSVSLALYFDTPTVETRGSIILS